MMNSQKMRHIFLLTIGMLLFFTSVFAQISEGGLPPSFKYRQLTRNALATVSVPIQFSIEDLKTVDAWQAAQGAPLRVATLIDVDLNTDNSGEWLQLAQGEKIWQLRIYAKDASAIMLYYKRFHIPEGGRLFIYNTTKTHVLGAYTHKTNPPTARFATEFVAGDDIILEYEALQSDEKPIIEIEQIGYGYNHLYIGKDTALRAGSGSCMVNINCEEGDEWQTEKNGACSIVQKIGNSTYLCSGSLVNNTAEDFTPYILTAYHCSETRQGVKATETDMAQWLFRFHYEKTTCTGYTTSEYQTMIGCTPKAEIPLNHGSDGMLLLLNEAIPANYNVYYNGWDRSNTPSPSGVSIHHPQGDVMKISTYTTPLATITWNGDGVVGTRSAHWNAIFRQTTNGHAVTEGGSSGSPLFTNEKLITGTLSGGTSMCRSNPEGDNLYGKLYYHWDKYSAKETERMDIYLDPTHTGATKLGGLSLPGKEVLAPTDLSYTQNATQLILYWNAPDSDPVSYNIYRNGVLLGRTAECSFVDEQIEYRPYEYSVSAVYANGVESTKTTLIILIKAYAAPIHVNARYIAPGQILISWDQPDFSEMTHQNLTGYNVYRNGEKRNDAPVGSTVYTDQDVPEGTFVYQVSSLYNEIESEKSEQSTSITVDNETILLEKASITPTWFDSEIYLDSKQPIDVLSVYSMDGKLVKRIRKPQSVVGTSDLVAGPYVFRLDVGGKTVVIRAIKK